LAKDKEREKDEALEQALRFITEKELELEHLRELSAKMKRF